MVKASKQLHIFTDLSDTANLLNQSNMNTVDFNQPIVADLSASILLEESSSAVLAASDVSTAVLAASDLSTAVLAASAPLLTSATLAAPNHLAVSTVPSNLSSALNSDSNLQSNMCKKCNEVFKKNKKEHFIDVIGCYCCNNWYHSGCGNLTKKMYSALLDIGEAVEWFCPICLPSKPKSLPGVYNSSKTLSDTVNNTQTPPTHIVMKQLSQILFIKCVNKCRLQMP